MSADQPAREFLAELPKNRSAVDRITLVGRLVVGVILLYMAYAILQVLWPSSRN